MANLKKRKDNRFVRTITIDGNRKFVYGKTASEADSNLDELKQKIKKGIILNDDTTVGEMAVVWYDAYIENSKKALKTKEMYKDIINNHVSKFADYKLTEIRTIMIDKYINKLNRSSSLKHKIKITLNQIFKAAKINKLIEDNPIQYVDPVKQDEPKRDFLEGEERIIVLDALKNNDRAYVIVQAFLYTGMRMGELLALTWNDIDSTNNTINISKSTEFDKGKTNIKGPKTKAGYRTIPIPPDITHLLLKNKDKVKSLYVFPKIDGKIHTQSSIYSLWSRIRKQIERHIIKLNVDKPNNTKIEIIKPTFRTLRHTYATALYDAGVDPKYAKYLLGHEDIKITLGIYTHISKFRHQKNLPKIMNLYRTKENSESEDKEKPPAST